LFKIQNLISIQNDLQILKGCGEWQIILKPCSGFGPIFYSRPSPPPPFFLPRLRILIFLRSLAGPGAAKSAQLFHGSLTRMVTQQSTRLTRPCWPRSPLLLPASYHPPPAIFASSPCRSRSAPRNLPRSLAFLSSHGNNDSKEFVYP
jgi:hypothetical protein